MNRSVSRRLLLIAAMAALLLPAARCGQQNDPTIQGANVNGSGPSSRITPVAGAGVPWFPGSQTLGPTSGTLFHMVNGHRIALGLGTLAQHDGMAEVAKTHTNDMVKRSFFSVVNPDGVDPYERMVSSSPRIDFDNAWAFVVLPHPPQGGNANAEAALMFQAMLDNSVTRAVIENPDVTHFVSYFHLPPSPSYATWIFAQRARP